MTQKRTLAVFFSFWVMAGLISAGFINATMRTSHARIHQSAFIARQTFGISILLGTIGGPLLLPVSLAMSGGGYYGWSLSLSPHACNEKYPEIWCGR